MAKCNHLQRDWEYGQHFYIFLSLCSNILYTIRCFILGLCLCSGFSLCKRCILSTWFEHSTTFVFCCPCPNLFERCCRQHIQSLNLQKWMKLTSWMYCSALFSLQCFNGKELFLWLLVVTGGRFISKYRYWREVRSICSCPNPRVHL